MSKKLIINVLDEATKTTYSLTVFAKSKFKTIAEALQEKTGRKPDSFYFYYKGKRMIPNWTVEQQSISSGDTLNLTDKENITQIMTSV